MWYDCFFFLFFFDKMLLILCLNVLWEKNLKLGWRGTAYLGQDYALCSNVHFGYYTKLFADAWQHRKTVKTGSFVCIIQTVIPCWQSFGWNYLKICFRLKEEKEGSKKKLIKSRTTESYCCDARYSFNNIRPTKCIFIFP